jgi:hypothetical protein
MSSSFKDQMLELATELDQLRELIESGGEAVVE